MKNKTKIKQRISYKRHLRSLTRDKRKKRKYLIRIKEIESISRYFGKEASKEDIINQILPSNLGYLLQHQKVNIGSNIPSDNTNGVFKVPKDFDIVHNSEKSFSFIYDLTNGLIRQEHEKIIIDYSDCVNLELSSQVFLDAILKDVMKFFDKCNKYKKTQTTVKEISGKSLTNPSINKLLLSVGSPAVHRKQSTNFNDVIPYYLCVRNREASRNEKVIMSKKEEDTTKLLEYVIKCLDRLKINLSQDSIDDLTTVIGETLINAEEHSTTNYRYSIGYFQDVNDKDNHFGEFNLVIMNFGESIYEKFKNKKNLNTEHRLDMNRLVSKYKSDKLFYEKTFEEETLWTLFALQDGVSSVHTDTYTKRGNGSIRFIDSFFKLKGNSERDNKSEMTILSGNTKIIFDGTYKIEEMIKDNHKYNIMAFNDKKSLDFAPDKKFVRFAENYFPGTIISVKVLISEKGQNE